MANHLLKEDGQQQQGFDPKAPHFFKIILEDTIQSGKLVIPKRFMRLYGENLSNVVLVKVPTGDVWKMELQRRNDSVCLYKGWKDFVSFYSLELGHLVVFQYELGISQFQVLIFDKTTTEIKYPMVRKSDRSVLPSTKIKLSSDDDKDAMETISDQLQPQLKTSRCRSPSLPSPRTRKTSKMPHAKNTSCPNLEKAELRGGNDGDKKKQKRMHPLNAAEKAEALLRANSFRSTSPYFTMAMQPSYVSFAYVLCVPGAFMQTHVPEMRGEVKLRISNGRRTWTARYQIRVYRADVKAKIFHGWKKFAEENELVVGDVCAFELMNCTKEVSFKVTIFKVGDLQA